MLATIVAAAVLQLVAVALTAQSWCFVVGLWAFTVLIPWTVVAWFVNSVRDLTNRGIIAAVIPFVYVIALGIGVFVGANLGAVPVWPISAGRC